MEDFLQPDMIEPEIPSWLLWHIVHPESNRIRGKQPKPWATQGFAPYVDHRRGRAYDLNRLPAHYQPHNPPGRTPHLGENDYRLWAEVRSPISWNEAPAKSIEVRCRWCQTRFPLGEFEKSIRKTHKNFCDFTWNLRYIYENALASRRCLVCGLAATHQHWGVPLCGDACENTWRFLDYHTPAFNRCIGDTRRAGHLREKTP